MRDLIISPKNRFLLTFGGICLLIYQNTYIVNHDFRSWILLNYFGAGLLIVYLSCMAINTVKEIRDGNRVD